MHVLVTGASGFVGNHLVAELIMRHHSVVAIGRNAIRAQLCPWFEDVEFVQWDIHRSIEECPALHDTFDAVVHLAWPGLPNYKDTIHFEHNLPHAFAFLKSLIERGCRRVFVTGTCFEYGMQSGCLSENLNTNPTNPYGLGKDCLRRFLECLQKSADFQLIWARLFYMYGPGQNSKSLLSQLQSAVERGDAIFPMSGGEQLRDFLPIERVVHYLADLLELDKQVGVVNVCSGHPISVRNLVEQWLASHGKQIRLGLGQFPYPDYEPFAFWGDQDKLKNLLESV